MTCVKILIISSIIFTILNIVILSGTKLKCGCLHHEGKIYCAGNSTGFLDYVVNCILLLITLYPWGNVAFIFVRRMQNCQIYFLYIPSYVSSKINEALDITHF